MSAPLTAAPCTIAPAEPLQTTFTGAEELVPARTFTSAATTGGGLDPAPETPAAPKSVQPVTYVAEAPVFVSERMQYPDPVTFPPMPCVQVDAESVRYGQELKTPPPDWQ